MRELIMLIPRQGFNGDEPPFVTHNKTLVTKTRRRSITCQDKEPSYCHALTQFDFPELFNKKSTNKKLKTKKAMSSLIGQSVGSLTVIKQTKHKLLSRRKLLCECDCGSSIYLSYSQFQTKKIKNCNDCCASEIKHDKIYYVSYRKKRQSLKAWSKELDLTYNYLLEEYKKGARGDTIFQKVRERMKFTTAFGETLSLYRWSRRSPTLTYWFLSQQWKRGLRGEALFIVNGKIHLPTKNDDSSFKSGMSEVRKGIRNPKT